MDKINLGPRHAHYKITVMGRESVIVKAPNPIAAFLRFIELSGHTRSPQEYNNCMMTGGVISTHTERISIEYFDVPII